MLQDETGAEQRPAASLEPYGPYSRAVQDVIDRATLLTADDARTLVASMAGWSSGGFHEALHAVVTTAHAHGLRMELARAESAVRSVAPVGEPPHLWQAAGQAAIHAAERALLGDLLPDEAGAVLGRPWEAMLRAATGEPRAAGEAHRARAHSAG